MSSSDEGDKKVEMFCYAALAGMGFRASDPSVIEPRFRMDCLWSQLYQHTSQVTKNNKQRTGTVQSTSIVITRCTANKCFLTVLLLYQSVSIYIRLIVKTKRIKITLSISILHDFASATQLDIR